MEFAELLQYVTVENALKVIGVLSMIATITPTPVDNIVLATLTKVINLGGMNFGKAKNASDVK